MKGGGERNWAALVGYWGRRALSFKRGGVPILHYCGLGSLRGKDGLYLHWWCQWWEKPSLPSGQGVMGTGVAQASQTQALMGRGVPVP